jgi:uncharacterized protein YqgQ
VNNISFKVEAVTNGYIVEMTHKFHPGYREIFKDRNEMIEFIKAEIEDKLDYTSVSEIKIVEKDYE